MQSYQNVSNSQHFYGVTFTYYSCKRLCKVIKMLAIHNLCLPQCIYLKLQTLMQSYQNVSNSQLKWGDRDNYSCCKRFCKVIKMLAIHNQLCTFGSLDKVANAYAKLSKCQQFTTMHKKYQQKIQLQTLMQSYQNVSNSQRKGI